MYFKFKNAEQAQISFFREIDSLFLFFEEHYEPLKNRAICAAVSGGADSLSLLILLQKWCDQRSWKLYCCTVDHDLRKESLDEALFVKSVCRNLKIEHTILRWKHDSINDEGKLENLARDARYGLIQKFCKEKNIPFIATGHNWNDQIETYELRKHAGSHELGLAGMSQIKTLSKNLKIIRPLIHFSKKFLENFLKSQNIEWKTDPMNFHDAFQRVVARKIINKYSLKKIQNISKKIFDYGRARYKIEQNAVVFLKSNCKISNFGFAEINKEKFLNLYPKIQIEVIRRLIWNIGMKKYPYSIDEKCLKQILNFKINTLGRCFIKIKKEKIFIFREKRNIPKENTTLWDNRFIIKLKLTKNQYIYSSTREFNDTISRDILVGFPCLYENGKVKCGFDEWIKFIEFVKKPDLLDIYCGVSCE